MADEIDTVEGAEVETTPEAQEQPKKNRVLGGMKRRAQRAAQRARNFASVRASQTPEAEKPQVDDKPVQPEAEKTKSPADHPDVNQQDFNRPAEARNMHGKGNVVAVNLDGMNAAQREAFRAGLESRGMKPEVWSSGLPRGNADIAYDLLLKGDDIQHFRDIATINAAISGSSARMDNDFLGSGKQALRIDVPSLDNADEVQAALGRMGVQFTVGGDISGGSDIRIQGDQIDRVQNVDRYPFSAQGGQTPSSPETNKPTASENAPDGTDAKANAPDGAGKAAKVGDLAQAADELKDLKSAARIGRLGSKGAKLTVVFGVAAAGGVAYLISQQYGEQREYAQALCDAGKISQDVCDEYIKLNQELEALVQAENIGAVGPTFLLTTPLLEMEIQDRFEEFAQKHNLSQDEIDLLAMGDLEVQSLRTEFGEELRDSLENYNGSLAALNDLKTAMDARDAAQRRFEGAGHRTRYQRRHQPLTQDELAERIANAKEDLGKADDAYLAELTEVLRDPEAANALFTIIGPEMQGELLKKTAGLAGDDAPEGIQELAALIEAYENASNGARGRGNAKDVAEAAVDAKIQELTQNGEGLAYLSTVYGGEVSDELDRGIVADATAEADPSAQQDNPAAGADQDAQQGEQTVDADQDAQQGGQTADVDQNTPQGGSGTRTQTRVSDFTTAKGNLDGPAAYIQTAIMFAQDGGYAQLSGVQVSQIDNLYGRKTQASVTALGFTALPKGASAEEIQAQADQFKTKLKDDPEFANAVISGLQKASVGHHEADVQRFLAQNGIEVGDDINAAIEQYASKLGVEVKPALDPVDPQAVAEARLLVGVAQESVERAQETLNTIDARISELEAQQQDTIAAISALYDDHSSMSVRVDGEKLTAEELIEVMRNDPDADIKVDLPGTNKPGPQKADRERREENIENNLEALQAQLLATDADLELQGEERLVAMAKLEEAQADLDEVQQALAALEARLPEGTEIATPAESDVQPDAAVIVQEVETVVPSQPERTSRRDLVADRAETPAKPDIEDGHLWDGIVWEDFGVNLADPDHAQLQQSLRLAFASNPDASYAKSKNEFFSGSDASYGEKQIFEFLGDLNEHDRKQYLSGERTIALREEPGLDKLRKCNAQGHLIRRVKDGDISLAQAKDGVLSFDEDGELMLTRFSERSGRYESYELSEEFVNNNMARLTQMPFSGDAICTERLGRIFNAMRRHEGLDQRIDGGFDPQDGIAVRMDNGAWVIFTPTDDPIKTTGGGHYESVDLKGEVVYPDDPRLEAAQRQTPVQIQRYDPLTHEEMGRDFEKAYDSAKTWGPMFKKLDKDYDFRDISEQARDRADYNNSIGML